MSKDTETIKRDAEVAQFRFALIAPVIQGLLIIPLRRSRLSGKTGTMIPVSGNHHEPA